ncbi:CUB domain-containing protein [Trichonephila clavipes]|nr:CUB domain-containing protein [Trichonephila clavipes]
MIIRHENSFECLFGLGALGKIKLLNPVSHRQCSGKAISCGDWYPPIWCRTKKCLTDYVDISTITASNVKELVGRYCGNKVDSPLLSMHPKAEIIFRSNHVIEGQGFFGKYEFKDENWQVFGSVRAKGAIALIVIDGCLWNRGTRLEIKGFPIRIYCLPEEMSARSRTAFAIFGSEIEEAFHNSPDASWTNV